MLYQRVTTILSYTIAGLARYLRNTCAAALGGHSLHESLRVLYNSLKNEHPESFLRSARLFHYTITGPLSKFDGSADHKRTKVQRLFRTSLTTVIVISCSSCRGAHASWSC